MDKIKYWLFESWISLIALLVGTILVLYDVATDQVDIVDKVVIFLILITYFISQLLNKIDRENN